MLSGVHRKDVSRRAKELDDEPAPPRVHTVGTELVARWLSEARYLDPSGAPRPLPRTHGGGGADSFAALAEAVSRDVRPRTILDELRRLGIVRVDDDQVQLLVHGFVPAAGFEARAFYFGESLHDHLATGANNLEGIAPRMLERSVYYDELSPASVAKLAARSEELGMQLLTTINREGMALEAADPRVLASASASASACSSTRHPSPPRRPRPRHPLPRLPGANHETQPGAVFRRRGAASASRDRGDPPAQLGAGGVRRRRPEDGERRHRRYRRRGTAGLGCISSAGPDSITVNGTRTALPERPSP